MKRKICLLIALMMCACSFTAAFASYTMSLPKGSVVYADPGYYAEIAETIGADGVFTIVEEQQDAYGNAWGRLKSGAGWVALSYENYLQSLYAGDPVYAGPGYDFGAVETIQADGTFTIVAQAWDSAGNLWGRLKSGAGWVFLKGASALYAGPVSAFFADEVQLDANNCHYVACAAGEYASRIVIFANEPLTDVCFSLLKYSDGAYTENPLYNLPVMTADRPLAADVEFYGDNTAYGISFADAFGRQRLFAISISGMDGSLVLTEC